MLDRRGPDRVRAASSNPLLAIGAVLGLALLALGCDPAPTATPAAATPLQTFPASAPPASSVASPAVTPDGSASGGLAPCTPAHLKASHGIVEGAAGSSFTTVVLVADEACAVDAFPALALRDSAGTALVGAASAGPGRLDLTAGAGYESAIRVGNWCNPEPSFPVQLAVVIGGEEIAVTGGSFPEEGNLPPCNGDGPPILEGGPWVVPGV